MKCVECVDYAECSKKHNLTIKRKHCPMAKVEYVKTNADRIRAMSDAELAEFLSDDERACPPKWNNCRKHINECGGCWLEWLQQSAES